MADNYAKREGTGKLTKFRSVELEGGIHLLIAGLADAEGNLLGSSSAPLPVSVEGGITIGDITLSNVEISNDVGNPIPITSTQLPGILTSNGGIKTGLVEALPTGSNVIGKTGYSLKRISTSFTRPADTTTYAIGDSISTSTTAPVPFELDLSTIGAVAGQSIEIRELVICSSIKQPLLPLINCYLSPITFTSTNDNAALDISDEINEGGGHFLNCDLQNSFANNSRVSYIGVPRQMVLAAADTTLYGALQAANAYVPGNAEKFTILAWIALL